MNSEKNKKNIGRKVLSAIVCIIIIAVSTLWVCGNFSEMPAEKVASIAVEYASGVTEDDIISQFSKSHGIRKVYSVTFETETQTQIVLIHARTGELIAYTSTGDDITLPDAE